MKKTRFYIFGYRDQYHLQKYGSSVRDLAITKELAKYEWVDSIFFFNRPVNFLEKINSKKEKPIDGFPKVYFLNSFSYDFTVIFKKRLWFKKCYEKAYRNIVLDDSFNNVVIDFLPIGNLPGWTSDADLLWYDYIDNFCKHNRYSSLERIAVHDKYESVKKNKYQIITGVSNGCFKEPDIGYVMPNGLSQMPKYYSDNFRYDFGFMGFITNKFDTNSVIKLAESGFTVVIFGEFYDIEIRKELSNVKNIDIKYSFKNDEISRVLGSFKVGLIPYKIEMLHDESPIKAYQYLSSGKHVLSTTSFNIDSDYVHVYGNDISSIAKKVMSLDLMSQCQAERYYFKNTWKERLRPLTEMFIKNA